jgi:glycosyltransferase involved in cell wall biosynthesis
MKVLQLIPNRGFYGAERVAYSLSKGIIRAGVHVIVVTSSNLSTKFSELDSVRVYALSDYGNGLFDRVSSYLKTLSQLDAIISREMPDIIHVHGDLARSLILALQPSCIVVETLHGVGLTRGNVFRRVLQRTSDRFAALSFQGNAFYRSGIVSHYTRLRLLRTNKVIDNAIDEDFARLVWQDKPSPIDGPYILWCSRLTAIKGADVLLRAFAKADRPDVRLILLSDGPQRKYLENLARSLNIENQTIFRGYVDEIEKARFFQHASAICVNLTHPELTQTLLEAVYSGNPVIACYDPEVDQIFGDEIVLMKKPSSSELTSVLKELLEKNERRSPANFNPKFTMDAFIGQYLTFYDQVMLANKSKIRNF